MAIHMNRYFCVMVCPQIFTNVKYVPWLKNTAPDQWFCTTSGLPLVGDKSITELNVQTVHDPTLALIVKIVYEVEFELQYIRI